MFTKILQLTSTFLFVNVLGKNFMSSVTVSPHALWGLCVHLICIWNKEVVKCSPQESFLFGFWES